MNYSEHQNQSNSSELKTYLVMVEPDYTASIHLNNDEPCDLPGSVEVGRYEAPSPVEAINMAKKDFLEWQYSQDDLDDIRLEVLELAPDRMIMSVVAFKEFGCFCAIHNGRLYSCPMLNNGLPETNEYEESGLNIGLVTAPESQVFLDKVNEVFATEFKLSDFSGR